MFLILHFAIAIIFISKIAFDKVLPFFPHEFSYLIYQGGLHPYINFFSTLILTVALLFVGKDYSSRAYSPFYKIIVWLILVALWGQGLLQILFVDSSGGLFAVLGANLGATVLIYLYGYKLPQKYPIEILFEMVWKWSFALTLVSLALWCFFPHLAFKGGRMTGVFKHIPHMVSTATLCFCFCVIGTQKLWLRLIAMGIGSWVLILTGTRSSLIALAMVLLLWIIFLPTWGFRGKFIKVASILVLTVGSLFFAPGIVDYALKISTGEASVGSREAQDGVASRWEEVERGWQYFLDEPWTGYGLAARFTGREGADVSSYNSFKDPHNLIVSAGVTAGYPGILISIFGFAFLLISVIKGLTQGTPEVRVIACFIAAHLPILLIYHVHLSVGGVADRIYWLCFAILGLQSLKFFKQKS